MIVIKMNANVGRIHMTELIDVSKSSVPLFVDPATLSYEQLHDPDYALKELAKMNNGRYDITCSRCHHCR